MTLRGDEDDVGVGGIDGDCADLLGVAQAEVGPGLARVGGLVDAVAGGEVGAGEAFAAADVDDVGIGGSDGDGADGAGGFVVPEAVPGLAGVGGLEDASAYSADVEGGGLGGDAGEGAGAAGAHGADLSPAHGGEEAWRRRRSGCAGFGLAATPAPMSASRMGRCGGTAGDDHDGSSQCAELRLMRTDDRCREKTHCGLRQRACGLFVAAIRRISEPLQLILALSSFMLLAFSLLSILTRLQFFEDLP